MTQATDTTLEMRADFFAMNKMDMLGAQPEINVSHLPQFRGHFDTARLSTSGVKPANMEQTITPSEPAINADIEKTRFLNTTIETGNTIAAGAPQGMKVAESDAAFLSNQVGTSAMEAMSALFGSLEDKEPDGMDFAPDEPQNKLAMNFQPKPTAGFGLGMG